MVDQLRRYSLILFFVLAYAFTWLRWVPEAAAGRGWLEFQVPVWLELLGGYGPLIAALLVAALASGLGGIKELGARLVRWRVKASLYLAVLLMPVVFQFGGIGLYSLITGQPLTLAAEKTPLLELLMFFPVLILGFDGLGEEMGWRGFALPALLARTSPLYASLILGVLWGLWHLPYALSPGSFLADTPFWLVIANTIGLAVLHTWIFVRSGGSVLLAILFHAWNNMLSILLINWLPVYSQTGVNAAIIIVQWLLAGLLVLYARPFWLARRLGGEAVKDTDLANLRG